MKIPKRLRPKFKGWWEWNWKCKNTLDAMMYAYNLAKRDMRSCKGCAYKATSGCVLIRGCSRRFKDNFERERKRKGGK